MSLSGELALPQDIEIAGRKGKLHPLAWTEYGKVERSWEAHLRWVAIKSTEGLPTEERTLALSAAAEQVSGLMVDAGPLMSWIMSTNEGVASGLSACLEMEDGRSVTSHEISRWMHEIGGCAENGNSIDKWLIASGLRSDPTEEPTTTDESPSVNQPVDSDTSTEASLVGATES